MWQTLVIPVAFVVVVALLLWLIIGARGKWGVKLALIFLVPTLSIIIWRSLDSYMGWPTTEEPPQRSFLIWGIVREPNQKENDKGAIFVWLLPVERRDQKKEGQTIFTYEPLEREPRAYKLPYGRELHEGLEAAKEMIKEGRTVFFGRGEEGESGDGDSNGVGGDVTNGRDGVGGFSHGDDEYRFYELPPPVFQEKN